MPETFGGVDYALCFNPEQWEDARSACLADGGDLASIHDEETNDFLWGTASAIEYTRWWFGLSDLEEDGVFVWSDGTDLDYFDWGGGEPNGGTNENCVHWADWNDGLWNDIPCDHLMPYVCQF